MDEMTAGLVLLQRGIPFVERLKTHGQDERYLRQWLRRLLAKNKRVNFDLTSYARSDWQKLKTDAISLGVSFGTGRIFLPGAPTSSVRQVHAEHYFLEGELFTLFLSYLRCNFTKFVPDRPTKKQRDALSRLGKWLATPAASMELPSFQSFPNETDGDFWTRTDRSAEILSKLDVE